MSYIDKWRRTVKAQEVLPANTFVDPQGNLGGYHGAVIEAYQEGELASIITIGECDVNLASGHGVVAGDFITGNEKGLGTKCAEGENGAYVVSVNGDVARVLLK